VVDTAPASRAPAIQQTDASQAKHKTTATRPLPATTRRAAVSPPTTLWCWRGRRSIITCREPRRRLRWRGGRRRPNPHRATSPSARRDRTGRAPAHEEAPRVSGSGECIATNPSARCGRTGRMLPPSGGRPAIAERTTPFVLHPARNRRLPWRRLDRADRRRRTTGSPRLRSRDRRPGRCRRSWRDGVTSLAA
jgi:hypothetical protein